jgi:hypothetical protein
VLADINNLFGRADILSHASVGVEGLVQIASSLIVLAQVLVSHLLPLVLQTFTRLIRM